MRKFLANVSRRANPRESGPIDTPVNALHLVFLELPTELPIHVHLLLAGQPLLLLLPRSALQIVLQQKVHTLRYA